MALACCIYLLSILMSICVVSLWLSGIGLGVNIVKTYPKL
ncbi:putative membrane protein [Acinetobacter baumannii 625974]|uniref:Putative membrane protein n=1 Tax=Acinetobacter baumannii 625974 TaxID=1310607 RepID=A0A009PBS9_ACIBA|nr:putative membrane protein [Acinetobacter baumannii 625974]